MPSSDRVMTLSLPSLVTEAANRKWTRSSSAAKSAHRVRRALELAVPLAQEVSAGHVSLEQVLVEATAHLVDRLLAPDAVAVVEDQRAVCEQAALLPALDGRASMRSRLCSV